MWLVRNEEASLGISWWCCSAVVTLALGREMTEGRCLSDLGTENLTNLEARGLGALDLPLRAILIRYYCEGGKDTGTFGDEAEGNK